MGTFLSAIFMWPTCRVIHSHMGTHRDGHLFFVAKSVFHWGKSPKACVDSSCVKACYIMKLITQTCRGRRRYQPTLSFLKNYIYIYRYSMSVCTRHIIEIAAAVCSRVPQFIFDTESSSLQSAILQYKVGLLTCSFESPWANASSKARACFLDNMQHCVS